MQIHKQYDRSFLLETTKLVSLVNTIRDRLADHHGTTAHDSFQVFLSGDRVEELTDVDEVLALDNSRKRKIQRLVIVCSASTPGAAKAEHEVHVDFGRMKTGSMNKKNTVVAINVRSDDSPWANRALADVEEQVERTWVHYGPLWVAFLVMLLAILLLFLSLVEPRPQAIPFTASMWLLDKDLDRVQTMVPEGRVISDQELREVVTMQLRNVLEAERPTVKKSPRRVLLIGIPVIFLLVCLMVLMITCYPKAVFLWGDEVTRHKDMVQRRKWLWGVIVGVAVIGLLGKLLAEGVLPSFPGDTVTTPGNVR